MTQQIETIEVDGDGNVIVRNDEQVQMLGVLAGLRDAVHRAKTAAFAEGEVNESLHHSFSRVDWAEVECVRAERWLDDTGALGWRAYIGGPDRNNAKLRMVLRSKLLDEGWDNVEVVPE